MSPQGSEPPPPPPMRQERPIIIIKRGKGGHGGHHGGAWKVAYADFVTAMMALFIVLWLMSADQEVKEAVASFFNNPEGPGKMMGSAAAGAGHAIDLPKEDMDKLREKIQQALMTVPHFRELKDHVEMTITSDGLRIELLETEAGMFFESGKAVPTGSGSELLERLAGELGRLPNHLLIEGHTDAKQFAGDGTYSNWELSADRANSARRLMQGHGVGEEQVAQVRGFADRHLRHPDDPEHASNRRISVIVQYLAPPPPKEGETSKAPEGDPHKAPPGEKSKAAEGEKPKAPEHEPAKGQESEKHPKK